MDADTGSLFQSAQDGILKELTTLVQKLPKQSGPEGVEVVTSGVKELAEAYAALTYPPKR